MLSLLFAVKPLLVILVSLLVDRLYGEPRHHPLVLFGSVATWLESRLNRRLPFVFGVAATLLLCIPPVALVAWLQRVFSTALLPSMVFEILVLAFVIGWQSLREHAAAIYQPLLNDDLTGARQKLALIVSRETANLDQHQVAGSTIESVLENGHDSLFASLFWYALLGPWAALLHRLINTLDAMWGYRTPRFERFGKFAARFDDLLGYVPARLTAVSYALAGVRAEAFRCWFEQARSHGSPNGGVVMAAGAGAIQRRIGGPFIYYGKLKNKPWLGLGDYAAAEDIRRAVSLVSRSLRIWLIILLLLVMVRIAVGWN